MHDWYKRKLLQRLTLAWPECPYSPVEIKERDTRTWEMSYHHLETGEQVTGLLLKSELRRQENSHEAALPSLFRQAEQVSSLPAPPDAVVLACGPDTAYYSIRPTDESFQAVRRELPEELQQELEAYKLRAQEEDEYVPTRWVFEGQNLMMRDKGGSQFKWILENDAVILSISRGKKTGILGQARLSSEYLWGCNGDLGRALSQVHVFLTTIFGQHFLLEQAGLDLAADVLFLDMTTANIKEQFLSRAVLDDERPVHLDDGYVDGPSSIKRRWKKLSGLSFGMHTSPVSAVIYNKRHEIKYHAPQKKWMIDRWRARAEQLGIAYTEDMDVFRIEVRFTRPAFRQFPDISGAYEVLPHVRDLWTYGVGHPGGGDDGLPDGWLRYVVPSHDSNRARWPVHPAWEIIQHAFDAEHITLSDEDKEQEEREALLQEVDAYLEQYPLGRSKYVAEEPTIPEHLQEEEAVIAAFLAEQRLPSPLADLKPFIRIRKREVNMEHMIALMAGCLATLEAWRQDYEQDEPDAVKHDLLSANFVMLREVANRFEEKQVDFHELVEKKRADYGLIVVAAAQAA